MFSQLNDQIPGFHLSPETHLNPSSDSSFSVVCEEGNKSPADWFVYSMLEFYLRN